MTRFKVEHQKYSVWEIILPLELSLVNCKSVACFCSALSMGQISIIYKESIAMSI